MNIPMRRRPRQITVLSATVLATLSLAIQSDLPVWAQASTHSVCASGCDFTSIQSAVDGANEGDTIELAAGTYFEAVIVHKDLTIRGAGMDSTVVDGSNSEAWHVFHVFPFPHTYHPVTVGLSDMTVQNANGCGVFGVGVDNPGNPGGNTQGSRALATLSVDNCRIRDSGCGVGGYGPASVQITNSTISENEGCGVESRGGFSANNTNSPAYLTMENCLVQANGCGVFSFGRSSVVITTTTISDNDYYGVDDGGISTQVHGSTISANGSCGMFHYPDDPWPAPGPFATVISTSTISGNEDCGISAYAGYDVIPDIRISESTIVANNGPAFGGWPGFVVSGSIVADNSGGNCWTRSEGHNLSGDVICDSTLPSDITDTDPMLLPLADNGGPTPTHALQSGSSAIDAGGDICAPTDQRGGVRPQDGDADGIALCDIGAFELAPLLVEIDIKPGSYPNSINPRSHGEIPVALLGSEGFDVADVDVTTLRFGPHEATPAHNGHVDDANFDGIMDLVAHFRTQETGIGCGFVSATLTGSTIGGRPFSGTDSMQTVGCRGIETHLLWGSQRMRRATEGEIVGFSRRE